MTILLCEDALVKKTYPETTGVFGAACRWEALKESIGFSTANQLRIASA